MCPSLKLTHVTKPFRRITPIQIFWCFWLYFQKWHTIGIGQDILEILNTVFREKNLLKLRKFLFLSKEFWFYSLSDVVVDSRSRLPFSVLILSDSTNSVKISLVQSEICWGTWIHWNLFPQFSLNREKYVNRFSSFKYFGSAHLLIWRQMLA